jgi:hypothetical protein
MFSAGAGPGAGKCQQFNNRIWGREFESLPPRHSATAEAVLACAASGRILAAMPRRFGSQPKISKTTPCKVAKWLPAQALSVIPKKTFDTSGKSTALLHHRTIHQAPVGLQWRAIWCDVGENAYP